MQIMTAFIQFEGQSHALEDGALVGGFPDSTVVVKNGSRMIGFVRSSTEGGASILQFVPVARVRIRGTGAAYWINRPFALEVGLEIELAPGCVATVDHLVPGRRLRETTVGSAVNLQVFPRPRDFCVRFLADADREILLGNKPALLILALLHLGAVVPSAAASWSRILALVEHAEDSPSILWCPTCHYYASRISDSGEPTPADCSHTERVMHRTAQIKDSSSKRRVFDMTVHRARRALSDMGVRWPMPPDGPAPTLIMKAGGGTYHLNDQGVEIVNA